MVGVGGQGNCIITTGEAIQSVQMVGGGKKQGVGRGHPAPSELLRVSSPSAGPSERGARRTQRMAARAKHLEPSSMARWFV